MGGLAEWFIHGDLQDLEEQARKWAPLAAGGLFGAGERRRRRAGRRRSPAPGASLRPVATLTRASRLPVAWWVWADALVHAHLAGAPVPFKFQWPGIVATAALVLINLVSRADVAEAAASGEEGAEARARAWLLLSWILAFAAVGGAVAVLLATAGAAVGVASVVQSALVLTAALVFWSWRSDGGGGDYTMF